LSPLRGVTLAGLAKKYPKNGGVRKANLEYFSNLQITREKLKRGCPI
jgi:hypothetical protein